jgi:hypothetical protein
MNRSSGSPIGAPDHESSLIGGMEPRRWSRIRWWSMLALIFTAQLALIFWLGARRTDYPGRTAFVPGLRIAGPAWDELLALNDPTLFALPHQQGFAGTAWLTVTNFGAEPFIWSEPPRWLTFPIEELGAAFRSYIATNPFGPPEAPSRLEPEFLSPQVSSSRDLPQRSTLRLTGGLALAIPLVLKSWANAEILTNSVVQVLVGSDGKPVSVTLLSRSGSEEADHEAVQQATRARFQRSAIRAGTPAERANGLRWGQMVFEWHTLPLSNTNLPTAPP